MLWCWIMKFSRNKKRVVVLVFLLILYIVPIVFSPYDTVQSDYVLAQEGEWLEGWNYRKEITLSGATGAGIDYQVNIHLGYDNEYNLTLADNWADNAHQGVCTDGTYIYSTNTSGITKYEKDGSYISSHDTSSDGTYGDYIGDLTYYSSYLYISSHDSGFTDHIVMKYDLTLNYITEYDIAEPSVDDWDGGFGIDYDNSSFWTISDRHTNGSVFEIQQYSTSFVQENVYTIDGFIIDPSWHYQGLSWYNSTYIFCPIHEGSTPYIDVYKWDGTDFEPYERITQPTWESGGKTYTAGQGIEIEEGDIDYVWLASRNGINLNGEIGKFVLGGPFLSLESHCEMDYSDVRFTDNDKTTLLDYWREDNTNDSFASYWVKIDDSLETSATIFVYSGNSTSEDISNGADTFILYEDWTSESINDAIWEIKGTDGSVSWSTTDAEHGSVIKVEGAAGPNRYYFISDQTFNEPIALRMKSFIESTVAPSQITQIGFESWGNVGRQEVKSYDGNDAFLAVASDGTGGYTAISGSYFDSWHDFGIQLNNTNSTLYVDNSFVAAGTNSPNVDEWNIILYCRDSEYDLYNDWVFIHKWVDAGPEFVSSSDEETLLGWINAGIATFYFDVHNPFTMWSISAIYIFAGIIMIPASTIFLVAGGREKLNVDKVFYFLIAFIIGWALVIGGVMT